MESALIINLYKRHISVANRAILLFLGFEFMNFRSVSQFFWKNHRTRARSHWILASRPPGRLWQTVLSPAPSEILLASWMFLWCFFSFSFLFFLSLTNPLCWWMFSSRLRLIWWFHFNITGFFCVSGVYRKVTWTLRVKFKHVVFIYLHVVFLDVAFSCDFYFSWFIFFIFFVFCACRP